MFAKEGKLSGTILRFFRKGGGCTKKSATLFWPKIFSAFWVNYWDMSCSYHASPASIQYLNFAKTMTMRTMHLGSIILITSCGSDARKWLPRVWLGNVSQWGMPHLPGVISNTTHIHKNICHSSSIADFLIWSCIDWMTISIEQLVAEQDKVNYVVSEKDGGLRVWRC